MNANTIIACLSFVLSGLTAFGETDHQRMMQAFESGLRLTDSQQYDSAIRQFDTAIKLANELLGLGSHGLGHFETAKVMEHKANCLRENYELLEARRIYGQIYRIAAEESGSEATAMARRTEGNLAGIALQLGDLPKAEQLFKKSMKFDADDYGRAFNEMNLGWTLYKADRLEESRSAFQHATAFWKVSTDDEAEANRATCLHGMGMLALKNDHLDAADRYFTKALAIRRKSDGDRRQLAYSIGMAGVLQTLRDQSDGGTQLLREAEEILKSVWKTTHVDIGDLQHDLALALGRSGSSECLKAMDLSRRVYRKCAADLLVGLAQAAQLRYLSSEQHRVMDSVALACKFSHRPDANRYGWEWLLNSKGFSFEILAQQRLLARSERSATTEFNAADRLSKVRRNLVATANNSNHASRKTLTDEEQKLAQVLGIGDDFGITSWAVARDVQSRIPEGAVLLDCAFVDRHKPSLSAFGKQPDSTSSKKQGQYFVWVVSRDEIQLVKLGSTQKIDAAIADLRVTMEGADKAIEASPRRAKELVDGQLKAISELVWTPVSKAIGKPKKILVSPDGGLWLLPWSALINTHGRYLVEDHELSFIVSARQLLGREAMPSRDYAMIVADPDFGLSPSSVQDELRKSKVRNDMFPKRSFQASSGVRFVPRNVKALPATQSEARSAKQRIEQLIGAEAYLFTQERALESIVKAVKRPKIAVFATHGFLLDADQSIHPLVRSGLILAGVNKRSSSSQGDDGILTALEVLDCDFRGTELVMLSACDTALGQNHLGEGIAGLQQAFHLAGAKRVFAKLWKVDDRETSLLMGRFWKSLSEGNPPSKAMREAQLEYMENAKARLDYAHPWLWAAPMLTEFKP
ncbi:MAG: CHAT domain-containing tetratricopeptide repeat protein [Planctomycetota bacterium]